MSIDSMFEKFKDMAEIRSYAESQYKTILELKREIQNLKDENEQLKVMLTKQTSLPVEISQEIVLETSDPQEATCKRELYKLEQMSKEKVLTMEEVKKVEILTKVLTQIRASNKPKPRDVSEIDTDDLLNSAMVDSDE